MPPKAKADNTALRELKRDLRDGHLKNLYVFHGEEVYLREHYLGQLKKAASRRAGGVQSPHRPGQGVLPRSGWSRRWTACP